MEGGTYDHPLLGVFSSYVVLILSMWWVNKAPSILTGCWGWGGEVKVLWGGREYAHMKIVWQLFCRELKNKLESEQTSPILKGQDSSSKQGFRLKYLLGGGYMLWKGWDWWWVLTLPLPLLLWVVQYDRPSLQFSGENLLFCSRYADVVIRADEYTAAVLI